MKDPWQHFSKSWKSLAFIMTRFCCSIFSKPIIFDEESKMRRPNKILFLFATFQRCLQELRWFRVDNHLNFPSIWQIQPLPIWISSKTLGNPLFWLCVRREIILKRWLFDSPALKKRRFSLRLTAEKWLKILMAKTRNSNTDFAQTLTEVWPGSFSEKLSPDTIMRA